MLEEKKIVPVSYTSHPDLPSPGLMEMREGNVIGRFGKCEVEITAGRLVLFMRERKNGMWQSFTMEELRQFYIDKSWGPEEMLDGLTGAWRDPSDFSPFSGIWETDIFLVNSLGGRYSVTEDFVHKCLKK